MYGYGMYKPYVSVAQRRAKAVKYAAGLAKKGQKISPVEITGRKITTTFWGQAWCDNLEQYSDFESRLPRGRTYVRNGSVIDLQIARGVVTAIVSGSEIYNVKVEISPLAKPVWTKVKQDCSQSLDSLIDLLQGRFSKGVMERLTRQEGGLFPTPKEIKLRCSCPDYAVLCKHVAAVLYGVGARLDSAPEMLFQLRGVDHCELIGQAVDRRNLNSALAAEKQHALAGDLGEIFGIELTAAAPAEAKPGARPARSVRKKPAAPKSKAASKPGAKKPAASQKKVAPKKPTKKVAPVSAAKLPATLVAATKKESAKKPSVKQSREKQPASRRAAKKRSAALKAKPKAK